MYSTLMAEAREHALLAAAPIAEFLGAPTWYVASGLLCVLVASAAFTGRPLAGFEANH